MIKRQNIGTQIEYLFCFSHAIKRGVPILLHQKKVVIRKGGMKYEQIQFIGCTLNWVEKYQYFFLSEYWSNEKLKKIKISNVRDFYKG